MSTWQQIANTQVAVTATGNFTSPGPTVSITSAAAPGNSTLVAWGSVYASASGGLSSSSGVSITDDASNPWVFSAVDSQFPPSIYTPGGQGYVTFVAWCINAAPVTSVTFSDSTGHTDNWNVCVIELINGAWPDGTVAVNTPAGVTSSTATGTVTCTTPQDAVFAAAYSSSGNPTGFSASGVSSYATLVQGFTDAGAASHTDQYALISALNPPGLIYGGGVHNTNSGSYSGSLNVLTPGDLCVGDLLVYDILGTGSGTLVTAWPAGFTQQILMTGTNNANHQRYVATKLADGTEGGTLDVTVAGISNAILLLYVIRGVASATPANTATYTASGYQTSLVPASLTIANSTDLTLYGYGGVTSAGTETIGINDPGGLSNWLGTLVAGGGTIAGIGWGTDVSSPGSSGSSSTAVDTLDWAMDFTATPLGVGGQVTATWTYSGSVNNGVAMASFGPLGVPTAPPAILQMF